MITSTKFEVDMTIHCRIIILAADPLRDRVTFDLDFLQFSRIASHVINLSTKFEDPRSITLPVLELSVMTYRIGYY